MKRLHPYLVGFYTRLLRLYPAGFSADFGDEMLAVFWEAAESASERGAIALTGFGIHEARGLVFAACRAHLTRDG